MVIIAARDEVAVEPRFGTVLGPGHEGRVAIEIVEPHGVRVSDDFQSPWCHRVEQVLDNLLLGVDGYCRPAGQRRHVDKEELPVEREIGTITNKAFTLEAIAEAEPSHQADGHLLKHTRADATFDKVAITAFYDNGINALRAQQMRKEHAGWTAPMMATSVRTRRISVRYEELRSAPLG